MTHKVHPKIFRVGASQNWKSRWFGRRGNYSKNLKEDYKIRDFIRNKFPKIAVESIEIERTINEVRIHIRSGRPGLIIGRGGEEIEKIKKEISKIIKGNNIKVEVEEIKNPEASAATMAAIMAEQLEKRMPYRRVMKQGLDKMIQNKEVEGAKVMMKGRLNGAEIARTEWIAEGKIPLQTIRADIDYAHCNARTTYGTIGVKVWIYKGEKFEH